MSDGWLPRPAMVARFRARSGRLTLPDVRCDLVWVGGRLLFTGPMTRARPSRSVGMDTVLVSFDPLAARLLAGAPLVHFTDRIVPFADVAPRLADRMLDWLHAEDFGGAPNLTGLAPPSSPAARDDERLRRALPALREGAAVRDVADRLGLSERQLERIFTRELGIGPRTYARIVRLRRTVDIAQSGGSLAAAAALGGYADQPHFNRDVRDLTGVAPTTLLGRVGNVQDAIVGDAIR